MKTRTFQGPFELLRSQHDNFKSLLSQFKAESQPQQRRALLDNLIRGLSAHEAVEEAYVQGLFKTKLGEQGAQFYNEALTQDQESKRTLAALEKCDLRNESEARDLFNKLETALQKHMSVEEGTWWPALEPTLSPIELDNLLTQINRGMEYGPTHPHPLGPSTSTMQKVMAPVVGALDRTTDAVFGRSNPEGKN